MRPDLLRANAARLHSWRETMRQYAITRATRKARRAIVRDLASPDGLLMGIRRLRAIDPDRGHCRACGEDHALTRDGRLRRHGCGFGDRELPAREVVL